MLHLNKFHMPLIAKPANNEHFDKKTAFLYSRNGKKG